MPSNVDTMNSPESGLHGGWQLLSTTVFPLKIYNLVRFPRGPGK